MSENNSHSTDIISSDVVNPDSVKNEISVPTVSQQEQIALQQQYQASLVCVLIIFAVLYVGCSWIRRQIDKLIEVKGIRLAFTVVVLPLLVVFISGYFIEENKKYIYLLALIISIVTSERSTVLTVDKRCQTKDDEIDAINAKAEKLNGIILSKISEFKSLHLSRLMLIANDKSPLSAEDVREQVYKYTHFMMFESTFLHTLDELEYKTNNEVSRGKDKTLDSYNGVMN